jgi:protein arginine kinase activator
MKCQHCEKPATFHITELTGPEPQEVHLCEDHAQLFLAMPSSDADDAESLLEPGASAADESEANESELGETEPGGSEAGGSGKSGSKSASPSPGKAAGKQKKLAKTAEDLSRVDQRTCPKCGITFHEFRQQGRLGCAHDYDFFQRELEPLLANIHGEKLHTGKRPRTAGAEALVRAELNRLKEQMREAVEKENYEQASQLRDQIRQLDKDGANS